MALPPLLRAGPKHKPLSWARQRTRRPRAPHATPENRRAPATQYACRLGGPLHSNHIGHRFEAESIHRSPALARKTRWPSTIGRIRQSTLARWAQAIQKHEKGPCRNRHDESFDRKNTPCCHTNASRFTRRMQTPPCLRTLATSRGTHAASTGSHSHRGETRLLPSEAGPSKAASFCQIELLTDSHVCEMERGAARALSGCLAKAKPTLQPTLRTSTEIVTCCTAVARADATRCASMSSLPTHQAPPHGQA